MVDSMPNMKIDDLMLCDGHIPRVFIRFCQMRIMNAKP